MADGTRLTFTLFGRDVSAGRTLERVAADADRTGARLDALGGGALRVVSRLGLLAASATQVAGGMQAAAAAAVTMSGAAAALPGIIAPAAVGVAALKVGVAGMGEALAAASGDAEEFAEATEGLAPSARRFAQAVRNLMPQLRDLQKSVQQKLFAGLGRDVTRLAGTFLPDLRRAFGSVAESANAAARESVAVLTSTEQAGQIRTVLDSASTGFVDLGAAVAPVLRALIQVTAVGTDQFLALAEGIRSAAEGFDALVERAAESGALSDTIEAGIASISDLVDVLRQAARIVGGLFSAGQGTGGSALEALAGILGDIADQVARPEFQAGLSGVFAALGRSADALGDALPAVADALVALAPALASVAGSAGVALADLLISAAGAAQALAPALTVLANVIAVLAPHATQLVAALVVLRGATLAYGLAAQVAAAGGLVAMLRGLTLVRVATVAWTAAQRVLNLVLRANPIGLAITALAALAAAVIWAWRNVGWFRAAVQAFGRVATSAFRGVLEAVRGVAGWIRANWPVLLAVITGPIGLATLAVVRHFGRIRAAVQAIPRVIRSAMRGAGDLLQGVGRSIVQGLARGIRGATGLVIDAARALAGLLPDWVRRVLRISSPSRVMAELGAQAADGYTRGLAGGLSGVRVAAAGVTAATLPSARTRLPGVSAAAAAGVTVQVSVGATLASAEDVSRAVLAGLETAGRRGAVRVSPTVRRMFA